MGYMRQTALVDTYIADTKEDLILLPKMKMGSICFVISENTEYICNSKNRWIAKGKVDNTNYYTKTEIDTKILSNKPIGLTENEILAITLTEPKRKD